MRRLPVAFCALIFLQTAIAGDLLSTEITALSRTEILENGESLPLHGYLSTSQPDEAVLELIAAAGYVAVVDLRGEDEDRGLDERAAVESLGMRYVSLPIPSPEHATFENAAALDEILADIEGPVLLHCYSGNRVGSLFALTAKAEGASSEDALAVGKEARLTRWEPTIREKLGLE